MIDAMAESATVDAQTLARGIVEDVTALDDGADAIEVDHSA